MKELTDESKDVCRMLDRSINQYQDLQESMTRQKILYLKKLEAEFDLIYRIIDMRK